MTVQDPSARPAIRSTRRHQLPPRKLTHRRPTGRSVPSGWKKRRNASTEDGPIALRHAGGAPTLLRGDLEHAAQQLLQGPGVGLARPTPDQPRGRNGSQPTTPGMSSVTFGCRGDQDYFPTQRPLFSIPPLPPASSSPALSPSDRALRGNACSRDFRPSMRVMVVLCPRNVFAPNCAPILPLAAGSVCRPPLNVDMFAK